MKDLLDKIERDVMGAFEGNIHDIDAPRRKTLSKIVRMLIEDNLKHSIKSSSMLNDPREISSVWSSILQDGDGATVGRTFGPNSGICSKIEVYPEEIGGQIYPWIRILVGNEISKRFPASTFTVSYKVDPKTE